uniref:L-Fucosyltransferase n=1 Tax=Caligus rogercresseyi TaxID=217165 RepID=C1BPK1_CALRO|nr:Galactoside 2-alpha-L-fucosyltransferase 1 [Caligus rogercresseyi]
MDTSTVEPLWLDLALLAACHHTILSYGTFSFWGGWLSGGHRILPNHVFDVTPMDDPFDNTLNSFRLPDVGTLGLSNEQKMSLGRSSFKDID